MKDWIEQLKILAGQAGIRGKKNVCNYAQETFLCPCICKFWK